MSSVWRRRGFWTRRGIRGLLLADLQTSRRPDPRLHRSDDRACWHVKTCLKAPRAKKQGEVVKESEAHLFPDAMTSVIAKAVGSGESSDSSGSEDEVDAAVAEEESDASSATEIEEGPKSPEGNIKVGSDAEVESAQRGRPTTSGVHKEWSCLSTCFWSSASYSLGLVSVGVCLPEWNRCLRGRKCPDGGTASGSIVSWAATPGGRSAGQAAGRDWRRSFGGAGVCLFCL